MNFLEALLCLLAILMLVPGLVLLGQVLLALPVRKPPEIAHGPRPRAAVIVPAHNESLLIAGTLRSIASQCTAGDRLLVVADNCNDQTANIAIAAGAEVIVRTDANRKGKIYALDFGVRHLERDPPAVVLFVDADCRLDAGAFERLVRVCAVSQRPVQALNLMHAPAGAPLSTRIAEFAWLVKNRVRAAGMQRLGLPCQLTGTGMAFPWTCIRSLALTGDDIAEDCKLGLEVARAGTAALFCAEARITSYFPVNAEGIASQRKRWEHGHLALISGRLPPLFLEALAKKNLPLLSLVIDVSVPPLSLLTLIVGALFFAALACYAAGGTAVVLLLATASLMAPGSAVLAAWVRFGRNVLPLRDLAYGPVYALRKIPLYLKFVVSRQVEWVRSRRDGE